MESLYQSFFIDLWAIWLSIGIALLYYIVRRAIQIDNFFRKGLALDDKLNKLDDDRRKLMTHVNDFYNHFENELDALSGRFDKIEKQKR